MCRQTAGYLPVGVTNASDDVKQLAAKLQLPYFISTRLSLTQQVTVVEPESPPTPPSSPPSSPPPTTPPTAEASAEADQAIESTEEQAADNAEAPPLVITQSVRSGQQIYARGRSLVVLGGVSSGAEVLADESIFVLGPLKGRALAGIGGNTSARIFCHSFDAELISIAHHFTTCDDLAREESAALRPQEPTAISLRDDCLHFESTST